MAEPLINLESIGKTYTTGSDQHDVLHHINLSILPNEFVAIIGPSGSGKSTLLNIIGLLDRSSSGNYVFDQQDVNVLNQDQRANIRSSKIGFIFQNFNLISRTSALANVELPLIYQNIPKKIRHKMALEALENVGLADKSDRWPSQLSGGEQQRVAIARALVNKPALILADEPTGSLDSKTGQEIISMLTDLHSMGHCIILITHDPVVANIAERKISIHDGHLIESGNENFRRFAEV